MLLAFSAFTISVLKVIAVVVVLLAMIILLRGIGHLFSGAFDTDIEDVKDLRNEVSNKEDVIGDGSVFRNLVGGQRSRTSK